MQSATAVPCVIRDLCGSTPPRRCIAARGLIFNASGFLLDEEPQAARIGLDDAEAEMRCLALFVQRLEAGCDERLPQPHFGRIAHVLAIAESADGKTGTEVVNFLKPKTR